MGFLSSLTKTRSTSKKEKPTSGSSQPSDTLSDPLSASSLGSKMGEKASTKAKINKNEDPHPKGGSAFEKIFNKKGYDKKNRERGESIMDRCGKSLEYTMKNHRAAFADFCEREFSGENLDAYEAIEGGVPPRSVYKTWIENEIVNLPAGVKKKLDQQAADDHFDAMDLEPVRKELAINLADTLSRFRFDEASIMRVGSGK